jgi:hypothetical protein
MLQGTECARFADPLDTIRLSPLSVRKEGRHGRGDELKFLFQILIVTAKVRHVANSTEGIFFC